MKKLIFLFILISSFAFADQPRFRYLVFRNSNGHILLDMTRDLPDAPPFMKDRVKTDWSIPTDVITRTDLTVVGPLVTLSAEETARNAQQAAGQMSQLVGGVVTPLAFADWKGALETGRENIFTAPGLP